MSDSGAVQAILGNTAQPPPNPLVTMQNWQNLANQQVQQAEGIQSISNAQTQQQIGQQSLVESRNNFIGGMVYAQHLTGGDTAAGYDHVFDTALNLGADPNVVNTLKQRFDAAPDDATRAQLANATGLRLVNPQIAQAMTATPGYVTSGVKEYPAVTPGVGFPGQGQPQFGPAGAPPPTGGTGGYFTPSAPQPVTGPPNPATGAASNVPLGSTAPPSMGGTNTGPAQAPGTFNPRNPPPIAGVPGVPQPAGATPQTAANQPQTGQPAMPGQVVTGLPPQFETSRQMGNQLVANSQNYTQNKADYSNLLTELSNLQTGPTTATQEQLGAFLQKWGGSPWMSGITTPQQLADTESFNKIAQTIANRQAGILSGSNQSQQSAMSATPNLSLSTPGNTQIIHKLEGNEDAIGAKADAWNAWASRNGQGTFNDFSSWWNKNVDVRSFQAQYMGPDEVKSIGKNMTPQEWQGFKTKTSMVQQAQTNPNGWLAVVPPISGGQ